MEYTIVETDLPLWQVSGSGLPVGHAKPNGHTYAAGVGVVCPAGQ